MVCASAAGCGSSAPVSVAVASYQTPEQATLSWFSAINQKDKAAAVGHFAPAAAYMMAWGGGDTSTWATFSDIHCKLLNLNGTDATVNCTFVESQAPSVGNPDSFWDIYLVQQPGKRWLITNYGQG